MVSEAQEKLARQIADAGIWKYSKVVELMEKNSKFVGYLKTALAGGPANASYRVGGKLVSATERAYANARLAEELGASQFAQAYVYYLCGGSSTDVAKQVTDVSAKVKTARESRPETTVEWIEDHQAQWLEEKDAYMAARRAKCQE